MTETGSTRRGTGARLALGALLLLVTVSLVGCEVTGQAQDGETTAAPEATGTAEGTTTGTPGEGQGATPTVDIEALNNTFNQAANQVLPSVVNVGIRQRVTGPGGEDANVEVGNGSGVVIRDGGYILTNNHVVAQSDDITVRIQGVERDATIVGRDPQTDLAVIRVEGADLPSAQISESLELAVGDWVLAVGSPFGLDKTVTTGIVSNIGRATVVPGPSGEIAAFTDLIQTDAPINPGNSGGPLVDLRGRVVGINTFIETGGTSRQSAGVGFAIPIDFAMEVANQLIETGDVQHPLLGVSVATVDQHVAEQLNLDVQSGALVQQVQEGSGAAEAGLQEGDVIVRMGDTQINAARDVFSFVRAQDIGSTVEIEVVRDGERMTVQATIGSD